jgi:chaperone modulatory protein CbpM
VNCLNCNCKMRLKDMEKLIPASEFCTSHNIEVSFIRSLQQTGLIEITSVEETVYIHESQLQELEKIVHLYFELDINLEGIQTINHLLQRINNMHDQITSLRNRLRLYDAGEY